MFCCCVPSCRRFDDDVKLQQILTYHFKINWKVDFRFGIDLTLVNARVFLANRLDSQVPTVRVIYMDNGESHVGCVDECV